MATGRQQPSGSMDRAQESMDRASGMAKSAKEKLSSVGQSARQRVGDLTDSMREQPLALGAIGVAIGAVMAAMAPRTQKEDELMGETRDRLVDQVKDVANAAVGTVTKEASKPTVGVHHSFSDAPTQTVPPTPQPELPAPKFGPKAPTRVNP
jgi:hypothetical protein